MLLFRYVKLLSTLSNSPLGVGYYAPVNHLNFFVNCVYRELTIKRQRPFSTKEIQRAAHVTALVKVS
jgi:hypothetical protein